MVTKLKLLPIAVIGGRDFNKPILMRDKLMNLYNFSAITIITGDARGADSHAVKLAKIFDIPFKRLVANWDKYGKDAGFIRNVEIEERAIECVAFWDGRSSGTKHTIELFQEADKKVTIVGY